MEPGSAVLQYCISCVCKLKLNINQNCYEAATVCTKLNETEALAKCPPAPEVCSDGRRPQHDLVHTCCLACKDKSPTRPNSIKDYPTASELRASSSSSASSNSGRDHQGRPRHGSPGQKHSNRTSAWNRINRSASLSDLNRGQQAITTTTRAIMIRSGGPRGATNPNYSDVNYHSAEQPETLWLFKVISRASHNSNEEFISAVKSVLLCPRRPAAFDAVKQKMVTE